jgi:hypothetical protein
MKAAFKRIIPTGSYFIPTGNKIKISFQPAGFYPYLIKFLFGRSESGVGRKPGVVCSDIKRKKHPVLDALNK